MPEDVEEKPSNRGLQMQQRKLQLLTGFAVCVVCGSSDTQYAQYVCVLALGPSTGSQPSPNYLPGLYLPSPASGADGRGCWRDLGNFAGVVFMALGCMLVTMTGGPLWGDGLWWQHRARFQLHAYPTKWGEQCQCVCPGRSVGRIWSHVLLLPLLASAKLISPITAILGMSA